MFILCCIYILLQKAENMTGYCVGSEHSHYRINNDTHVENLKH